MSGLGEKPSKTVLITGCSAGGIGSALAQVFHDRGLHVFATARSPEKMSHLERLPNVTLLKLDVQSPSDIAAAVEAVTEKTGGKLDILINNSGQSMVMPALDTDLAQAKNLFDVNFWGVVAVTQAFSPLVIAAKGTIVNICSLSSVLHVTWNSFYNASKAALKMYGETLRLEVAPLGVKVVNVIAGLVATNIFANCPRVELPPDSPYKAASKEITVMASGSLLSDSTPVSEFARKVADEVLGGATGAIWKAKMASTAWFMSSFMPTWLLDRLFVRGSGLEHLG